MGVWLKAREVHKKTRRPSNCFLITTVLSLVKEQAQTVKSKFLNAVDSPVSRYNGIQIVDLTFPINE
jgi:hypothetical protein